MNGHGGNGVMSQTAPETDEQEEEAMRLARIAARAEAKAAARAAAAGGNGASKGGPSVPLSLDGISAPESSKAPKVCSCVGGCGAVVEKCNGRACIVASGRSALPGWIRFQWSPRGADKPALCCRAPQVEFLTKKQREEAALLRLKEKRDEAARSAMPAPSSRSHDRSRCDGRRHAATDVLGRRRKIGGGRVCGDWGMAEGALRRRRGVCDARDRDREREKERERERERDRKERQEARERREKEKELQAVKDMYLGVKEVKTRVVKPSEKFARIYKFDWEPTEDTSKDTNPLYSQPLEVTPLFGKGYRAGIDMREQRKQNRYLLELTLRRQEDERKREEQQGLTSSDRIKLDEERERWMRKLRAQQDEDIKGMEEVSIGVVGTHWREKTRDEMTERDWRIFREDFDIRIQAGMIDKACFPLRSWDECSIPPQVMKAVLGDLKWTEPSPIQRAAIPIGMHARDVIGIAETGSGKTGAFAIPMINYVLNLPAIYRDRVSEEGPLALVMAPTRELADQIEDTVKDIAKHTGLRTALGVGGKPIEDQGFVLRKGVEILVGTPGRLKDLIERRYLVLNQCNYVVLDEADRMVDMGFEEDLTAVLDSMGGLLKSEREDELQAQVRRRAAASDRPKASGNRFACALCGLLGVSGRRSYSSSRGVCVSGPGQVEAVTKGEELYRVTAMFSATMPPAVERIAKKYLRSPAVVKIGDQEGSRNKRIEQRVVVTTEPAKKNMLVDILNKGRGEDKFIVFVNAKKQCDVLARNLGQCSIACGILHGGKSQDQRESSLESFRAGDFNVLVATDVAARGLDIPDVSHVVNYDMPSKIEQYCHRIGRTGRAGRDGVSTTFVTDDDAGVLFDLKSYLESTGCEVPATLARHPSAQQAPGSRGEDGKVLGKRRDTVIFSK
jgi:ATP-dependent RNA helicase DDX23/PRP28